MEHATVLQADITRNVRSRWRHALLVTIDKLMSGSSLEGKGFKKPQNSELYGFLLHIKKFAVKLIISHLLEIITTLSMCKWKSWVRSVNPFYFGILRYVLHQSLSEL